MGDDVVLASDESLIEAAQTLQVTRVEPLPGLIAAGAAAGLVSVSLDGDAVLRRVPRASDSFAAALLRRAAPEVAVPEVPAGALIQSLGPGRTYPTVSYYQALDPAAFLPAGFFRDRTVIVGVSLQSAPTVTTGGVDAFATSFTPLTGRLTSGAEMQATLLDNLKHRLFIVPAPSWAEIAFMLIAGAAAALVAWRGTSWRTALACALLVMAAGGASYALLRAERLWLPPLLPAIVALGVASTSAGLDFAFERRTRRRIARAFEQYLSPELVARLTRDPAALKLGGEQRMLTILFCDVRGFTGIAESMRDDPERLTELVMRLLDPLSEAVLAAGGTIDKYIGDCVMAFWNAPLDDPDHARHAVECALAMLQAVDRLNGELAAEAARSGSPALRLAIGIGVNTGTCVVGNMGSRRRFEYTALGDAVNLASRLEAVSKDYGTPLVVGAATHARLGGEFFTLELDRMAVRGRSAREPIFAVLGRAGERRDPRLQELLARHAAMLDSTYAGDHALAARLSAECAALAPELAPTYAAIAARMAKRS